MLFFLPSILVGLIAGFASGGKLSRLAQIRFRYGYLIIGAFVLQVLIFSGFLPEPPASHIVVPFLHILSNLVLVGAIAANWGITGMRVVALGLMLNLVAIAANGGYMPVSGEVLQREGRDAELQELRETGHVSKATLITTQTLLPFLGDIFALDLPPIQGRVFSAGDIFISLGAFVLIFAGMRQKEQPLNHEDTPAMAGVG